MGNPKLFIDRVSKVRECGDCHQRLPFSSFAKRSRSPGVVSTCLECSYKKSQAWCEKNPVRYGYSTTKHNAGIRDVPFTLTFEEYEKIVIQPCYYCGRDLWSDETMKSFGSKFGSKLDRINNDLGYTPENIVACCGECNMGRVDNYTSEEWKAAIQAIMAVRKQHGK